MSQSDRLLEVQPDDDLGARRGGERPAVREVAADIVRQDVEEGERIVHHHRGVRLSHV